MIEDQVQVEGARGPDPGARWPAKLDVFGIGVTPTNYEEATSVILDAAQRGESGVVSCHSVHALIASSCDAVLAEQVNTFQMVAPDGQPVRWALNLLHAAGLRERVYGPELMLRLCGESAVRGVPIYLYGGRPGVTEKLRDRVCERFPGLQISGMETPPFSPLSPEQDEAVVQRINSSGARLVFIGLGFPKQDRFAYAHCPRINAIQVCVGAAFDFHAGVKSIAPAWMQRRGLEWLYRLIHEPRRLAGRYFVTNSIYLGKLAAAMCGRWLGGARRRDLGEAKNRTAGSPGGFDMTDDVREQYRRILQERRAETGQCAPALRTLGLTACSRGEGVTTTAVELAVTAAMSSDDRVLLVDANLAHPAVHAIFGVPPSPGFADAVLQGEDPLRAVRSTAIPNLSILPASGLHGDPARAFASTRLASVVASLKENFDLVVFDMPDASLASLVVRLGVLLDGTILVMESERVAGDVAQRTKDVLVQGNVRLQGVLMSKQRHYLPRWLERIL